jgi:hypothetical protein
VGSIIFDFPCGKCHSPTRVQANFAGDKPLQPGCTPFPGDNKFRCSKCGTEHNVIDLRRQLEAQFKKPILA